MIYGTEIKQSEGRIGFWHIGGTRQVLLEWDATKIKGVSCFFEDGGLREIHSRIEFIEDGYVGRAIITFTADPYEGETLKEGSKTFYLQNEDDSYRQNIKVDIMLHGVNETNFCQINAGTIFVPYYMHNTIVEYTLSGDTTIASVDAPNEQGVYAMDNGDGTIQILTQYQMFYPGTGSGQIKKHKITITYGNGSVSYIYIWLVMPAVRPIFEDLVARINTGNEVLKYSIYTFSGVSTRELIYTGKAYKKPDENGISININKICESFLFEDMIPGGPDRYTKQFDYGKGFTVIAEDGTIIGTYILYNCWSYSKEDRKYGLTASQSRPIVKEIVRGQTFLNSLWTCNDNPDNENKNYCFLKESPEGSMGFTDVPGFDNAYLEPWQYTVVNFNTKNVKPDTNYLLSWDTTYKLVDNCGIDYVIHYLGANGGYSSFPIKANVNRKTNVTPHTINQSCNNTTSNFEVKTYMNEVEDEWEVTLPLLSKYEAGRIWELTQSPQIWLERLEDNKFIPVLIDDKKTDLKNNEKIRNYTLTFKTSQSKLRK